MAEFARFGPPSTASSAREWSGQRRARGQGNGHGCSDTAQPLVHRCPLVFHMIASWSGLPTRLDSTPSTVRMSTSGMIGFCRNGCDLGGPVSLNAASRG